MSTDRVRTLAEYRARYVILDLPKTHTAALDAVQWPDIDAWGVAA